MLANRGIWAATATNLANAWDQLWDEGLQDRVQLDAMGLIPSDSYMILCKARYYAYLLMAHVYI